MSKRYLWPVSMLALLAGLVPPACSDDGGGGSASGGNAGSGGTSDASAGWMTSACGTCVATSCSSQLSVCDSEPECSTWLGCLEACPADADGDADPSCEAACTLPSAGAALQAQQAVQACRAGSSCACGTQADASTKHPILSQTCPASAETNVCYKCEDENCCDTFAACRDDAACQTVKDCIKACAETAPSFEECNAGCFAQTPAGVKLHLERMACVNVLCDQECGEATEPCVLCQNANCAGSYVTCALDADCFLLSLCIGGCYTDKNCIETCKQGRPSTALTLLDAYTQCSVDTCSTECGYLLNDGG